MKDELYRIISKYFPTDHNTIHTYGDTKRIVETMRYLDGIVQYEKPDGYSIVDGTLFILEHFEFDSGNKGSNGSQQKREEAKDNRLFQQVEASEGGTTFHNSLTIDYTIDNYRKNATLTFTRHYRKIDSYKNHLMIDGIISSEMESITCFFIEDTTLLGNTYNTDSWDVPTQPLFLPCCDFFLDLFEKSPKLDCAFCGSWANKSYYLWFIDRTMISSFRNKQINTESLNLCNFTPHHVGVKMIIPDEKGNK